LLKKIIPQLDASYERKYLRLPSVQNRQISLADGVSAIHNCLSNENIEEAYHWIVRNQGSGGMMVSCTNMTMPSLNIGGFMGIFEQNMQTSLATVRWLHIENNDTIHIGLEIHQGHPTAVTFTPDGSTEIFQGLLLPEIEDIKQPATLIVDKGIYSANRVLRIKQEQEIYTISADTLIENTLNYEQFSFKIKSGS
ncbi:MAG: hypothetical protein OEY48_06590, partial [Gammaproteobacteria bacterium]|nr:hypothetical protein [Gammaproteobacteria bacterium]